MDALPQLIAVGLLRDWLPTPDNVRGWRARRRMNEIIYDLVDKRRRA
jgi:hypothetical protein